MSTNYYFSFKKSEELIKILNLMLNCNLNKIYMSKIEKVLHEKIHIGMSSMSGSIMQKNEYFGSVKQIRDFYENNKNDFEIVDEYDRKITFEYLENVLFNNYDSTSIYQNFNANNYNDMYRDDEGYYFCKSDFC